VHGGTFESGELPGSPPSEGPTAEERDPPAITQLISPSSTALPGQSGKRLSGFVADAASSIGVRLQGEGSGYWVVPVGAPDVNFPDQLSFALLFDLAPEGRFVTYGLGVSLQGMRDPIRSRALVPVG
jgi:hypothetical protein